MKKILGIVAGVVGIISVIVGVALKMNNNAIAIIGRHNIIGLDIVELCLNEMNKAPDFLASKLIYQGSKFNMLLCWCIGKAAAGMEDFYLLPVGDKLM